MPNKARRSPAPSTELGHSSVDNALRLLQLVQTRRAVRVSDVATELRVARSTAHRLLAALRHHGFVGQDKPNGVYRPGPALREMGFVALGQLDIRHVARPILEELREQTQETISLLMLEGRNVRFLDCVEGRRSVRVGSRTGLVLPAHCTAGGKAILAVLPERELARRYADGGLEGRTEASVTDWEQLVTQLEEVQRAGYATNVEESESGISAVGVAVRDPLGAPLAAIAAAIPTSRMSAAADGAGFVPALQSAQAAVAELVRGEV